MLSVLQHIRRLAARKTGRLLVVVSLLMLAFSGARFEFHAHASATSQDAHAHSHIEHGSIGDHSHELTLDVDQAPQNPDLGQPGLHAHELGTQTALPVVHFVSQLGIQPQARPPLQDTTAAKVLPSAPPIRPPII